MEAAEILWMTSILSRFPNNLSMLYDELEAFFGASAVGMFR
jgi:hypothetical protein